MRDYFNFKVAGWEIVALYVDLYSIQCSFPRGCPFVSGMVSIQQFGVVIFPEAEREMIQFSHIITDPDM